MFDSKKAQLNLSLSCVFENKHKRFHKLEHLLAQEEFQMSESV